MTLSGQQEAGRLQQSHSKRDYLTKDKSKLKARKRCDSHTPSRYFSWPSRSKYLRQNGNVPKFFLITFNKVFAEETRSATFGASAFQP